MKISPFKFLFYLIWPLVSSFTHAQNSIIDSLKEILQTQKEDSTRVNILNKLSDQLLKADDSTASFNTAEQAMLLAKKIKFINGIALSYFNMGKSKKQRAEALSYINLALTTYLELNDIRQTALVYKYMGRLAFELSNYDDAITYYNRSVAEFEKIGDKKEIAICHSQIAHAYASLSDPIEAVANFNKALKYAEQEKYSRLIANCLLGLGNMYLYQENLTDALKYFNAGLAASKTAGDSLSIAYSYSCIIQVYIRQKKFAEVLEFDSIAFSIYKKLNNKYGFADHYSNLSNINENESEIAFLKGDKTLTMKKLEEALNNRLMATKLFEEERDYGAASDNYAIAAKLCVKLDRLSEADLYAEKSLTLSRHVKMYDNFRNSFSAIVAVDSARGNFRKAFDSYKMFIAYRDSNSNKENARRLLSYEYETKQALLKAEQDMKDADANRVRNRQYFVIGTFLLLAIFLFSYSRQKARAKTKIEKAYSQLQSTQAQLIQQEKMASLGELTAGIAHEIQNPLNFVNNFSEVNKELLGEMKDELDKGNINDAKAIANDVIENHKKINHHGKRADAIVKGMLQHSRANSGQKEPTDINALADEYLRLAYHGLRAKDKTFNAKIEAAFDASIGKINIIPQDIGRVLVNLINNAFYSVNEKKKSGIGNYEPTVSIRTKKMGDKIEISVKDNGDGIPQTVLQKIFQPFFTTKPTGQGTGLGLSLAYDIVKAHGGELRVETKQGVGSEFVIHLPVV